MELRPVSLIDNGSEAGAEGGVLGGEGESTKEEGVADLACLMTLGNLGLRFSCEAAISISPGLVFTKAKVYV